MSDGVVVEVGRGDDVTINVAVGVEKSGVFVAVLVSVEKLVVLVIVGMGVSVEILGTQRI